MSNLSQSEKNFEKCALVRSQNALVSVQPTPANLQKLIERCTGDSRLLQRRARKLSWWLETRSYRLGCQIDSPQVVRFLSELTPEECKCSDAAFAQLWPIKKARHHICANPACGRGTGNSRAYVPKVGECCSPACAHIRRQVRKRGLTSSDSEKLPLGPAPTLTISAQPTPNTPSLVGTTQTGLKRPKVLPQPAGS
jgi:hypothetical protein